MFERFAPYTYHFLELFGACLTDPPPIPTAFLRIRPLYLLLFWRLAP
jgi:hypothetical protein